MKLIIIYGPPASGKYTIAKEIEKISGYRVFHNHEVIDLCSSVLDKKSPRFWQFARELRTEMLKEAIKQKIKGITITLAYTGESNFIENLIKLVEKNKGKVYLIKLNCNIKDLEKRVYNKSRKSFGKLKDKKALKKWILKYNPDLVYKKRESIIIDTGKLSAKQSAKKILNYTKK